MSTTDGHAVTAPPPKHNGWKVFGITIIATIVLAAVGIGAFLLGRTDETEKAAPASTAVTTTPPATTGATETTETTEPDAATTEVVATVQPIATPAADPSNDGRLDADECSVTRQILIGAKAPQAAIDIGCDGWGSLGKDFCGQISLAGDATAGVESYREYVRTRAANISEDQVQLAVVVAGAAATAECLDLLQAG